MKYAKTLKDIIYAFNLAPLRTEDMDFYLDTMKMRTGNTYVSPILDIYEACKNPSFRNTFLLMGHSGCGKSTELNKMSQNLQNDGYQVFTIDCGADLDLNNLVHSDLFILIGDALLEIAAKVQCKLKQQTINSIKTFWTTEIEEYIKTNKGLGVDVEAGLQVNSPSIMKSLINFFGGIKSVLRVNTEKGAVYRTKINNKISDWLFILNEVADSVTAHLNEIQPILILEELDKITNADIAFNIFSNFAKPLTDLSFPVIYTFPIALIYEPRFASLDAFYITKKLPMIKQETVDGQPFIEGTNIIREIVEKRADLKLFDEGVLDEAIKKTGGSLRDLFTVILASARIAIRRKGEVITEDDITPALVEIKNKISSRIERRHYDLLINIINGNRQSIENKEMMLELLHANAVLEYNNYRWYNVHPLIVDFLNDIGLYSSGNKL